MRRLRCTKAEGDNPLKGLMNVKVWNICDFLWAYEAYEGEYYFISLDINKRILLKIEQLPNQLFVLVYLFIYMILPFKNCTKKLKNCKLKLKILKEKKTNE